MYITRLDKEIKEGNDIRLRKLVCLLRRKASDFRPSRTMILTPEDYRKRLLLAEACLQAAETICILYRRYHNKILDTGNKD